MLSDPREISCGLGMEIMGKERRFIRDQKDQAFESVQGDFQYYTDEQNQYYRFVGSRNTDRDRKYTCPICGKPVRYGQSWRYYCDPCGKSWFMEDPLRPNLDSGMWKRMTPVEVSRLMEAYA